MKCALIDFCFGLRSRHPVLLPFAFILFVSILGSFEWVFRTGFFSLVPREYLLRHSKDLFTRITYDLASLKRSPPKKPAVYFVGGSSIAYAVHPDEMSLLLDREHGIETDVYNFGIGRQSVVESLAVIEQLPSSSGLVFVGLNPRILTRELDLGYERWRHHHLMLHSTAFNEFMEQENKPDHIVSFVFPHVVWRLKHHLWIHRRVLLKGHWPHVNYEPTWYFRAPLGPKRKAQKIRGFVRMSKNAERNIAMNLRGIKKLVSVAQKKNLKVLFVELPLSPATNKALGQGFLQKYRTQVRATMDALRVPYDDFLTSIQLKENQFLDAVHVLNSGRKPLQKELAHYLKNKFQLQMS